MKRFVFLSVMFLTAIVSKATVTFSMQDQKIKQGARGEITIDITNDEAFQGFELKINLPSDFALRGTKAEIVRDRLPEKVLLEDEWGDSYEEETKWTLSGAVQTDGSYKINLASFAGYSIEPGEGAVIKILYGAKATAALGDEEIKLTEIKYSQNEVLHTIDDDVTAKVTVYTEYTVTATSASETMGSVTGSGNYENGTDATLTATANDGYKFVGWSDDTTENPYTFTVNEATELTANFEVITYNVSYDLDGGVLAEDNPGTYTVESDDFTLTNPTKTGYTFLGWTGTGLDEAADEVTVAKGSTGDRAYTATWQINQYTMTFVKGNGEENIEMTQDMVY